MILRLMFFKTSRRVTSVVKLNAVPKLQDGFRNQSPMINPCFKTSILKTTPELANGGSELNFCLIRLSGKAVTQFLKLSKSLMDLRKSTLEFFVK